MRTKYRYNSKTLSYEKVKLSWGERIVRGLIFVAPTITLSFVFALFIAKRIDSPRETRLRQENAFYQIQFWLLSL